MISASQGRSAAQNGRSRPAMSTRFPSLFIYYVECRAYPASPVPTTVLRAGRTGRGGCELRSRLRVPARNWTLTGRSSTNREDGGWALAAPPRARSAIASVKAVRPSIAIRAVASHPPRRGRACRPIALRLLYCRRGGTSSRPGSIGPCPQISCGDPLRRPGCRQQKSAGTTSRRFRWLMSRCIARAKAGDPALRIRTPPLTRPKRPSAQPPAAGSGRSGTDRTCDRSRTRPPPPC